MIFTVTVIVIAAFMRMRKFVTNRVFGGGLDFTTAWRPLMQTTFRTNGNAFLAVLFAESQFAALAAQQDVAAAIDRRAAAQWRAFV